MKQLIRTLLAVAVCGCLCFCTVPEVEYVKPSLYLHNQTADTLHIVFSLTESSTVVESAVMPNASIYLVSKTFECYSHDTQEIYDELMERLPPLNLTIRSHVGTTLANWNEDAAAFVDSNYWTSDFENREELFAVRNCTFTLNLTDELLKQ